MSAPERSSIILSLRGRLTRADIPSLCNQLRTQVKGGEAGIVICDVGRLVEPDVDAVDALARLQLTARRSGLQVWLRNASRDLEELLLFVGLQNVLPVCPSGIEPGRQPEQGKELGGIEEEADPAEPIA